MKKIPKEKNLTKKQIQRRVNLFRLVTNLVLPTIKNPVGKELFLNTAAGKVRVLSYNMDNPDRLPLFINIHGSGFTMMSAEMDDPFMMNIARNANCKIISIRDYSLPQIQCSL